MLRVGCHAPGHEEMRNALSVALAFLVLASCGTSSTLVIEQPKPLSYEPQAVEASFKIRPATTDARSKDENAAAFEERLSRKLEQAGLQGLRIEYRFLHEGSDAQLDRWFTGGSGRRSVTVDVVFFSAGGQRLARIQAEGRVKPGLMGGSLTTAVNRAADEVAAYAIATFGS